MFCTVSVIIELVIDIDGLVQERRNLAVELRLSCTNPSIWNCWNINIWHGVWPSLNTHCQSYRSIYRWLNARRQYLQCFINGDIAVLYWTIDTIIHTELCTRLLQNLFQSEQLWISYDVISVLLRENLQDNVYRVVIVKIWIRILFVSTKDTVAGDLEVGSI